MLDPLPKHETESETNMGLFKGIESAKTSKGGVYPLPGVYTLEITSAKTGVSRAKRHFFVAEFRVLASTNADRPEGSEMSWMVMLDHDSALGNIKAFLSAATGSAEDEIDEAGVEAVVSAANPLKGCKVRASAVNVKTRAGGDFTKMSWSAA